MTSIVTKVCKKCEQEKSVRDFYRTPGPSGGYRHKCIACYKADELDRHRRRAAGLIPPKEKPQPKGETKTCTQCKVEKDVTEFHRSANGYHTKCAQCRNKYNRDYRKYSL